MVGTFSKSTFTGARQANSFLAGTALAVALILAATSVQAQVIVVQSNAKGLKAGSLLANNSNVTIPKGKQVVFVLPSGATRTVSGPFKGRAADLTKGVKSNSGVFDAVKRYVVTGGANQKSVGAMRSAAPSFALSKKLPFSWRMVPVTSSGDFCIEKGAAVSLVRPRADKAQAVTIVDMISKRRARVVFAAGAAKMPWPGGLSIDAGATYALLASGRPARQMRMRLISPLPAREDTLQVLHGQRCQSQFRAFIREMQTASK
mgnify:CR=1 FL=1